MVKKRKKIKKKRYGLFILVFILLILVSCVLTVFWIGSEKRENSLEKDGLIAKNRDVEKAKSNYHEFVKAKDGAKLYVKKNDEYVLESVLYGGIELALDSNYEITDSYFKVLDLDFYISYDDVVESEGLSTLEGEYKTYSNYVPYNENVVLKEGAKLYVGEDQYYEVNGGSYPIFIKDTDQYGIEYHKKLVYVLKEDVDQVVESLNTESSYTDGISVLNYHYVVSATNENGELSECQQTICITDEMFDSHIKYLKDNGYYGVSMRDLELFIDGKIQLPEHSVSITIDDGWYVSRAITILEKYQILGTLFLIGSLASPEGYGSEYLEIHSHTWDMHTIGQCSSSVGRGGILCLDEDTILEDLRKSRESLNNTTYFCYPFYDYNERAISLLQKAGFTMAFAGELRDSTVRVGQNKYKIPRYVIVNYTSMEEFIQYVS